MMQKTTIYNRTDALLVFIGNSSEQVTLTFNWLYVGAKSIFVKNFAPEILAKILSEIDHR